ELVAADGEHRPRPQPGLLHGAAVDHGAVGAAEVLEHRTAVAGHDAAVRGAHQRIVEEQPAAAAADHEAPRRDGDLLPLPGARDDVEDEPFQVDPGVAPQAVRARARWRAPCQYRW